jgi:putative flippase GtrA
LGEGRTEVSARFARFVSVGGLATAMQYVILVVLVRAVALSPTLASAIGYVLSSLANYLLNYRFTFRSNLRHGPAILKFALLSFTGLLINSALMHALTAEGRPYLVAQVCATAVVLVWNFVGNSLWTFAGNRP